MVGKFFLQTYGCQMNVYESGVVRKILADAGFDETTDESSADLLLMMTCSVRSHAEARALGRLADFRSLRARHPGRLVGVLGCMAQRYGDELVKSALVDIVVGPDEYLRLPELIEECRTGSRGLVATRLSSECYDQVKPEPANPVSAFVTVMRGCDNYCSYCIVPYVKGRERSRPLGLVLDEVRALVDRGIKDITLLGQNVLAYRDGHHDFAELLAAVARAAGSARVRFLTSHPRDLSDKVLHTMAETDNVCPSLHLPLQSGSDRILALMNRGYTRAQYLRLVARARALLPGLALSTDVMVAFPGETEADFLDTIDIVQRVRFDSAYMFRFSARPGTRAAELEPKVSAADSGRRLARLIEVQNRITLELNRTMVGQSYELLIEGPSPRGRGALGRTRSGKVVVVADPVPAGALVVARVTHLNGWTPVAQLVRSKPVARCSGSYQPACPDSPES
ncbi:MAG: tRNA (N6-isopentenyl adenosine(37)-C2)-methylthiotransferase MiaB [candidate division WOR-3 bacterium]